MAIIPHDGTHEWVNAPEDDHTAVHRAAFHRDRRVRRLNTTLWTIAAGLGAATLLTDMPWFAASGGAVALVALLWRWMGRRDNPTTREREARRAEYAAYFARKRTSDPNFVPDPRTDPECARLCAAIDNIDAVLPWWHRTT